MGLFAKIMGEDDDPKKDVPAERHENAKRRKQELENMGEGIPGERGSTKTRKEAAEAKRKAGKK